MLADISASLKQLVHLIELSGSQLPLAISGDTASRPMKTKEESSKVLEVQAVLVLVQIITLYKNVYPNKPKSSGHIPASRTQAKQALRKKPISPH